MHRNCDRSQGKSFYIYIKKGAPSNLFARPESRAPRGQRALPRASSRRGWQQNNNGPELTRERARSTGRRNRGNPGFCRKSRILPEFRPNLLKGTRARISFQFVSFFQFVARKHADPGRRQKRASICSFSLFFESVQRLCQSTVR